VALWLAAVNAQSTLRVPVGGDLQAAIDRAQPGDVILLEPGATYTGNFRLREKSGARYITIRSAADPSRFPSGGRVGPEHAQWMPTLKSPNNGAALATDPRAHHWRLQWLAFDANSRGLGDIIQLGDGSGAQRDLGSLPHDLMVDGLVIRGDDRFGQKRGIALNSASTVIRNSDIRGIRAPGQDSQAICGWNGPGPYLIENNYLEAAGENVMFGGADPAIRDLVPSDITVRGNYMSKPLAWRGERTWTVKNLFELKNARRVLIEGNLFEHNWLAAQTGYAILFTVRNEDGRAPWSVVEDVTFQYNIVRHVASAINILGEDNLHPSQQTRRIQIRHNLFYDVDGSKWGGDGRFLMIGDGPAEVLIDHNTIVQTGTIVLAYGKRAGQPRPIPRFRFTNNLTFHNEYGIFGDEQGIGDPSIRAYFGDAEIRANVIAGGDSKRYPAGNFFPNPQDLLSQFVDHAAADYRLRPDSRFRGAATDGTALGAEIEALLRRVPLERPRTPVGTRPSRKPG
jgi:hypothetical protein